MEYISLLEEADNVTRYGGKASNLAKLVQAGFPVPNGFVVGLDAFKQNGSLRSEAMYHIDALVSSERLYAVRSSAVSEDSESASWAGQFETFLNIPAKDVLMKIRACHMTIKVRARVYAENKSDSDAFQVAVVVQEMVDPIYAGLSFTKDPSTGANKIIIEYVRGLGEPLVHGDVDPERIVWERSSMTIKKQTEKDIPIPYRELVKLSEKVEKAFGGVPQDIEWAYDGNQMWLVQTRPITTLQERGAGKHYLGDPAKLFYWGPSRALPLYMSDFVEAEQQNFDRMLANPKLLNPPKMIALFHSGETVWLLKQAEFNDFVQSSFAEFERSRDLDRDIKAFQEAVRNLDTYMKDRKVVDATRLRELLLEAWRPTLPGEFALYGAETVLSRRLERLNSKDRAKVWGMMTLPDRPTFMQQIDIELARSINPADMAEKYPWIQDGYGGVVGGARQYFESRLPIVKGSVTLECGSEKKRNEIVHRYNLTRGEVHALDLARKLAKFMDDRKAWMMRTRRYLLAIEEQLVVKQVASRETIQWSLLSDIATGNVRAYYGWSYLGGIHRELDAQDAALAWDWYIEYRAATTLLKGVVASNGGRHFINGEAFIANQPTDGMPENAVLVVASTSPSYVPLMRKARALVTDHGGMMSHAAIVAREFGLPCIVGTKRATKTLKDGDKVVLDLVKGEVNK